MTSMTRRIVLMAMAVAMSAMMAASSGCAKRTEPSRPSSATDATGATGATGAPEAPADTSGAWLSVDDQVREAVFKHMFTHNASGMKDRAGVYFLAIDEGGGKRRDPSPALMARFAAQRPRVEPVSRADISFDQGVIHRQTGERGILFRIGAIKRVKDDVVEVEGGYHEGNLSASGNVYRVERIAGVWVVTGDKMEWIA